MGGAETAGLVLAGGGARGAYEVGALSVLLPELDRRGQRPRILVGTSVGALNAAFLAAHADEAVDELVPKALAIWEQVEWGEVAHGLISGPSAWRAIEYVRQVLGLRGARLTSLLDPRPLHATLRSWVDFPRIAENVASGRLHAAAVVATSARTGRSVVFHQSAATASPPPDARRGIDYVTTPLREEHVLASSAIPVAFPAVHVKEPGEADGWYWDGGTRLNTPIKPALALGAARVVVVALSPLALPRPTPLAAPDRPDALEGVGQIMSGLFGDQLVADMQTLATINRAVVAGAASPGARRIPYIAVAPPQRDTIARLAVEVARAGGVKIGRHADIGLLARLVGGGGDAGHAELLSFLLFTPEFSRALIEQGRLDAQRWLQTRHDLDDLWQEGPLPTGADPGG